MPELNVQNPDFVTETQSGRPRETAIYVGIVTDNEDEQRMGRLKVYIPELGGSHGDENSHYIVSYASPFAGATPANANKKHGEGGDEMSGSQKSYGFWMVPPDKDNEVLVCFANGDTRRGFWFACLYQQNMNHMVPGIAINKPTNPEVKHLAPVVEYNKKDDVCAADPWDPKRPIFEPLHNGLRKQGLYTDPERGPSTTSARREAPSKVFGFITPHGNTVHVDDNPKNEFIRLRTKSGVQLLIHETGGYIYMISKNGNSWLQVSDEGIDMYSKKGINIRGEGGVNVHSDKNIHQHSVAGRHRRATKHTTEHSVGQKRTTAAKKIKVDSAIKKEDQSNPVGGSGSGGGGSDFNGQGGFGSNLG
jgi:hypothetical protein